MTFDAIDPDVRHEAARVLYESGCKSVTLFVSHLMPNLRAIEPGEGDPGRVLAVDQTGQVRTGPRGPMTAADLVKEIRSDPELEKAGWK